MEWIGFIWLRIGTSGGLLWTRYWTFGVHKMLGSSWGAAQFSAPQEGLSSVSKYVVKRGLQDLEGYSTYLNKKILGKYKSRNQRCWDVDVMWFLYQMLYVRHVQLQTGCDLHFSVKIASDLPPLLSLYLVLSKNIGKNNKTINKFVVKATCIESIGLPCSLVRCLGLHFVHHLMEVRWVLGEGRFQGILEMFICHVRTLFTLWHF
jgi:hypothetical protein